MIVKILYMFLLYNETIETVYYTTVKYCDCNTIPT